MVPQTYPSILNPYTNRHEMVVKQLASTSGLQRWTDYIPVKLSASTRPAGEQTTDGDGFIAINTSQNTSTGVAFKDWVPVYFDNDATDAWVVSASGYIPIGASGGAIAILKSYGTDAHVYMPGANGVAIGGLNSGNYVESTFNTLASVDSVVGGVRDPIGSIDATQATTANKPALRRGSYNQFPNSEMVGAVVGVIGAGGALPTNWSWGAVAGLTREVVAVGTLPTGEKYIDVRLSGTNTSGSTGYPDIYPVTSASGPNAAQGQTWVASIKASVIAGSSAGFANPLRQLAVGFWNGGTYLEATAVTLSADGSRVSIAKTAVSASTTKTTAFIGFTINNGSSCDITVRIAQPQLETGATAGDYSPTTSAAASNQSAGRYSWQFDGSNDSLALGSVPFLQTDDHCVIAGARNEKATGAGVVFAVAGTGTQRIGQLFYSSTVPSWAWVDDGSGGAVAFAGTAQAVGSTQVLSGRKSGTSYVGRLNGVVVQSGTATLGTTTTDSQSIGSHKSTPANFHNGAIGPVIVIKGTVSDADLLTLERWVASQTPNGPQF